MPKVFNRSPSQKIIRRSNNWHYHLFSLVATEKDERKKGINSYKLSYGGKITTRYSYQKIYSKIYNLAYNLYNLKNLGQRG